MRLTKKRLKTVACLISLILFAVVFIGQEQGWFDKTSQTAQQNNPGLYSIDHFVDGDTIAIDMDGKTENIRMIGIDTPETHKPNSPVQCYGPAASAYVKNLIGGQKVRLESDPKSTNRDRYDRLLRYVYLPDNRLIEAEIIKNGYGFAYTQFPFTKSDEFVSYQNAAKSAGKGLWSNCQPYQQSSGRWQTQNE